LLRQRIGSPDDRTESARAQEIVANAMTPRESRLAGEIGFRVEKVDRLRAGRVINVKNAARQRFVQIPGAPDRNSRRRGLDESLDLGLRHCLEDPLQNEKIGVLAAESKGEVIGKAVAGPISLVEDGPGSLLPAAAADVLQRDTTGTTDGSGNGQLMYHR
jgi:hypothetical protein